MKTEVGHIIKEMKDACRRSLFNGTSANKRSSENNHRSSSNATTSIGVSEVVPGGYPESEAGSTASAPGIPSAKRLRADETTQYRTWDTILAEASTLLPFMTDYQHGQVTRLAGILLLGFLLPQSTGNEFFLLQNLSSKRMKTKAVNQQDPEKHISYVPEKEDMGEYVLQLSLQERLECSPHRYNPDEFGEFDNIVFEPLENAFQCFLQRGLMPFLAGRPAHTKEVDLFHIIAMSIHPQPSEQSIRQTASILEGENSKIWKSTTKLMSNLTPHSFHLNYQHRLQLVQIVADCLVLPEYSGERASKDAPLFEGALPHLRASLYAFGMASASPFDATVSQCAKVSLTIQSGMDYMVKEEWSRLLHRLVDDRTNYPDCKLCNASKHQTLSTGRPSIASFSLVTRSKGPAFCPHLARGELLKEFLTRYSQSRHFSDESFLQYALGSLTDAIEMQVDCWSKGEEDVAEAEISARDSEEEVEMKDSENDESTDYPPCVLVSLLKAAKHLFYFLLPIKTGNEDTAGERAGEDEEMDEEESEESHRRDILVSCGIQLVHHWEPNIAKESCTMLLLAFTYNKEMWEDYVGAVFESMKIAIDTLLQTSEMDESSMVPIEGLVAAASQQSMTFASSIIPFLLSKENVAKGNLKVLFRLVAACSNARPSIAERHRATLLDYLKLIPDSEVKKCIVASILACRRSRYFADERDSESSLSSIVSSASLGGWHKYLIARQALLTGNFFVAKDMYNNLVHTALSETSFIWLSALEKVGEAEALLSVDGAKALPECTVNLRMAINTLRSLTKLNLTQRGIIFSAEFPIQVLNLRVSFLDLLTSIRQLTREMRLIGFGPRKYTRPHLHLEKIVKSFDTVGQQYLGLYARYGLFICQQSRSVLRTLQALCTFIAAALRKVFVDSLAEIPVDKSKKIGYSRRRRPHGDSSQPLTRLMKHFESLALKDMDHTVDAKIRAAAMLEIMEGVLKAPVPIPRYLTVTKSIPRSSLQLMWDPQEHGGVDCGIEKVEVGLHNSVAFLASGAIPPGILERSQIPFNIIVVWYKLTHKRKSPKSETKQQTVDGGNVTIQSNPSLVLEPAPVATSLSSSGTFFTKIKSEALAEEGKYEIDFKLGCRDIRGGEWELPMSCTPRRFLVKVVHSG